ncbi:hypothetical protein FOL47_007382 [Perkinsus chesapeaki]|uniref:Amine oxidase domain-containing protein n=1 Tax=Perkinsus chesapeaki TaxID=330153 RepID=A0A7J6LKW8_PERCH|nr:hypothetical protein FOL47_007382 [Perkinsus chesapeaki]
MVRHLSRVGQVRVPENASTGTTIQVRDPVTGIDLQVRVPIGVSPGGSIIIQRPSHRYTAVPIQTGTVVTEGRPIASENTMAASPVQEAVLVQSGPPDHSTARHHNRGSSNGIHSIPDQLAIMPFADENNCLTAASSDSETCDTGKRIAVIGSGLAGLTTAWALCNASTESDVSEVTIFERSDRLGLCSQSLSYSPSLTVDVPYRATSGAYYPTLTKLCRKLAIRFVESDWSISCTNLGDSTRRPFFEFRNWVVSIGSFSIKVKVPIVAALRSLFFTISVILNILYFTLTMPSPTSTDLRHITIADWMEARAYPHTFIYDIFLPWLAIFCSVSVDNLALCPADVAVEFLRAHWGDGRNFWRKWSDLGDDNCIRRFAGNGVRTLAEKLVAHPRIVVKLNTEVSDLNALLRRYNCVVVATEAPTAGRLLGGVDDARASLLMGLKHEKSVVWMHRDSKLLPKGNESRWRSGLNIFIAPSNDESKQWSRNAYVSVYLPSCDSELANEMAKRGNDTVIQTWSPLNLVSNEPRDLLRSPSYFTRPVLTEEYFETIGALAKLNGYGGVYLAGSYSYAGNRKIPLLENALLSGITAAAKILNVKEEELLCTLVL